SIGFDRLGIKLNAILSYINTPDFLRLVIIDGIYKVVGWVVAVMLPPMAIFFPLFTLLEDLGFLPRIAYNLDRPFRCCGSCGKQALTMCMGIGCNAVGVTGARIFGSERERIVAVITNSFIPCNGRFPAIISIITIFFISSQRGHTGSFECAFFLCLFILLAIAITMLSTKIISGLIRANEHITYTLELPPYRIPQISKTIIRSIYERTSLILTRAVLVAAPAGFILYLVSNITINGASVLSVLSGLLSPIGEFVGLDGAILLAFLFGMPANEIVIPVLLMIYLKSNSIAEYSDIDQLNNILRENGWTALTAVNFIIFSLFHFPCSTTLITIYKETRSIKWTVISVILPLLIGFLLCFVNKQLFTLIT
ncbi:MAG: ferrous iron transporter B, partial [Clostridia bacterium]|nr:ferrous iron transporter B [Clostridia bacterium]